MFAFVFRSSTRQTETQFEVWDDEVESILQAEKSFQQRSRICVKASHFLFVSPVWLCSQTFRIIEHIQHHRVAKNSAEIKQKHALRDKNLLEMDLSETQHSLQASRQQLEASKLRIQDLQGNISVQNNFKYPNIHCGLLMLVPALSLHLLVNGRRRRRNSTAQRRTPQNCSQETKHTTMCSTLCW